MTREKAIINAELCEKYLATYYPQVYLTMDIEPRQCKIHFFTMCHTEKEVIQAAKSLDTLRLVESELEFVKNEKLDCLTFDIYWEYEEKK